MPTAEREAVVDVFLLHGTLFRLRWWKRPETGAEVHRLFPWTNSRVEGSLAAKIAALDPGGNKLAISVLPWRGQNSSAARENGAAELAKRLEENPKRSSVIVAHSHGGNLAMRALQQLNCGNDKVLGVVCMATPFLQLLPRDPNGILWLRHIGLVFLLLAELFVGLMALGAAIVGVVGVFQQFFGGPLQELPLAVVLGCLVVGLVVLWLIPLLHGSLHLRKDLEAAQHTVSSQRQALGNHQTPIATPFLCIGAAGDEAGAWLEFWSMISALPYALRNRVVSSIGVASLTAVAFVLLGWPYVLSDPDEAAIRFGLALAFCVGIACGVYFFVTFLAMALAQLTDRMPVTFGSREAKGSLTHTAVSLTPVYARHVEFETYVGNTLLVHSIYANPKVQERVVKWVGGMAGLVG